MTTAIQQPPGGAAAATHPGAGPGGRGPAVRAPVCMAPSMGGHAWELATESKVKTSVPIGGPENNEI